MWLLILMKKCIKLPLNLNELTEIQSIFLDLIALNDGKFTPRGEYETMMRFVFGNLCDLEIVHDAATRGLSFIPRFADEEATNVLAKQLIDKIYNVNKSSSEIGYV